MFNYLFLPMEAHFDRGFGATGNAFKDAADKLLELETGGDDPSEHERRIPICYLLRHAIELHLKSIIVVLRWRFDVELARTGEFPKISHGGTESPITRVHSLATLASECQRLLAQHSVWLKEQTRSDDWELSSEFLEHIDEIEEWDKSSTFFRYPTLQAQDVDKSTWEEVARVRLPTEQDPDPPPIRIFSYTPDRLVDVLAALRLCSEFSYGFHAMVRAEVSGGE